MLLDMFMERKVPYFFAIAATCGVLITIALRGIYGRYLAQALHSRGRKKTWCVQLRGRFENYYKMKLGVNNVEMFIKSQMEGKRYAVLLLRTWERVVEQIPTLLLTGGVAAALYAQSEHFPTAYCLELLGYGGISALLCRMVQRMVGVPEARERVRIVYTELFENVLRPRYELQYSEELPEREEKREPAVYAALTEEVEEEVSEEEEKAIRLEELRQKREKRIKEKEEKEERAKLQQTARLAEKRRREEQRAKEKQEALQAVYEEKQRRLKEKYCGKMREECAVAKESAAVQESELIEDVLKEFLL